MASDVDLPLAVGALSECIDRGVTPDGSSLAIVGENLTFAVEIVSAHKFYKFCVPQPRNMVAAAPLQ